ncbi:MAG: hypothetical protein J6A53_00180 [Clostridia bacterium]|nr:hypothetical protein [Clostridia bacterium]
MKRRTTRKKQEDFRKKKRGYLTDIIVGIVLVSIFTILTFVSLYMYNQKPLTYSDVEYKKFTFESFEVHGNKAQSFYIYVKEEKLPLIIQSTVTSYDLKQKLYDIENGSAISCYVKPNSGKFSYTIVELKSDEIIFSLDYYNEQGKQDGLIGLVAMPICAIASLVFTLIFTKKYIKLKNANPRG